MPNNEKEIDESFIVGSCRNIKNDRCQCCGEIFINIFYFMRKNFRLILCQICFMGFLEQINLKTGK